MPQFTLVDHDTQLTTPQNWPEEILYLSRPIYSNLLSQTPTLLDQLYTHKSPFPLYPQTQRQSIPQNPSLTLILPVSTYTTHPDLHIKHLCDPLHPSYNRQRKTYGLFNGLHSTSIKPGGFVCFYFGVTHLDTSEDTDVLSDYDLSLDREVGFYGFVEEGRKNNGHVEDGGRHEVGGESQTTCGGLISGDGMSGNCSKTVQALSLLSKLGSGTDVSMVLDSSIPDTVSMPVDISQGQASNNETISDKNTTNQHATTIGISIDASQAGNEARFINDYRGVREGGPNAEFLDVWVKLPFESSPAMDDPLPKSHPPKYVFERRMAVFVVSEAQGARIKRKHVKDKRDQPGKPSKGKWQGILPGEEIVVSYGKGFWKERQT